METRNSGRADAIINPIVSAVNAVRAQGGGVVEHAICENVLRTVRQFRSARPVLAEAVHARHVVIVGARYDLDTGRVSLIEQPAVAPAPRAAASEASH